MTADLDIRDWQELLAVAAAVELGIFKELGRRPVSAPELSQRLGYDTRATGNLLAALEDLGHLERNGDIYSVSGNTKALVACETSNNYGSYRILHQRNLIERWLTIPEVVRSGKQVARPYTRERREVFIRSLDEVARGSAKKIADRCLKRAPNAQNIIDIGGGPGTYAREFARHCLRVTIFDCPEVGEIMSPQLDHIKEIEFISGDFTRGIPPGPFDLAFMGNIFHIYGPEENLTLLRRVRRSLRPGGVAAILDMVRGLSARAPLFAVTMMVNTDTGGTWTESDYRSWLADAGFENISIENVPERGSQLILANRS